MSKWTSTPVQLTAAHVAGTQPLIVEMPIPANNQGLFSIQNRSSATIELFFGPVGAVASGVVGQGIQLTTGQRFDFFGQPEFNGGLWMRGGVAGDYVVILFS